MTKKIAVLKNNLITNIAVWDGISEWDVGDCDECDITDKGYLPFGYAVHARYGNNYTHNIVIDGNSLAVGTSGGNIKACENCIYDSGLTQWDFLNMARDGWTTPNMISQAFSKIDPLYEPALGDKNILIVWEGINDISSGSTDIQAFNNLKSYCQARKLVGWKIIVGTITPRNGGATNQNTKRLSVNTMIRDAFSSNETWLDAIADVGADSQIGGTTSGVYYTDGLHLNSAGHNIAKTYFTAAINLLK